MSTENRYRYLNQAGKAQGPFWLADMRRHYRDGRIGPDTPVCHEGEADWDPARMFPEITGPDSRLPLAQELAARRKSKSSFSWAMWACILLLALFMAWIHFFVLGRFFVDE